jgi:hypothetical protein
VALTGSGPVQLAHFGLYIYVYIYIYIYIEREREREIVQNELTEQLYYSMLLHFTCLEVCFLHV